MNRTVLCVGSFVAGAILGFLGGMGSGFVLPSLALYHTGMIAAFAGASTGIVSGGCYE